MRAGRRSRRRERNKSRKTHDETNLQRLITNTKHDRDGAKWKYQTNQYNRNVGHLSSVVRSYVTSAAAAAGLKTWAYSDHVGCRIAISMICAETLWQGAAPAAGENFWKCGLMATCVFQKNTRASTLSLSTWLLGDKYITMVMSLLVHQYWRASMRGSSVLLVDFVVVLRS